MTAGLFRVRRAPGYDRPSRAAHPRALKTPAQWIVLRDLLSEKLAYGDPKTGYRLTQPGRRVARDETWGQRGCRKPNLTGEPGWDRTNDLLIKSQLLYH